MKYMTIKEKPSQLGLNMGEKLQKGHRTRSPDTAYPTASM